MHIKSGQVECAGIVKSEEVCERSNDEHLIVRADVFVYMHEIVTDRDLRGLLVTRKDD